jgi:hypothetical protein
MGYVCLNFLSNISEYPSKFILVICLGRRSFKAVVHQGKGNTALKPQQNFNKFFFKEQVGNFFKTLLTRPHYLSFKFRH